MIFSVVACLRAVLGGFLCNQYPRNVSVPYSFFYLGTYWTSNCHLVVNTSQYSSGPPNANFVFGLGFALAALEVIIFVQRCFLFGHHILILHTYYFPSLYLFICNSYFTTCCSSIESKDGQVLKNPVSISEQPLFKLALLRFSTVIIF